MQGWHHVSASPSACPDHMSPLWCQGSTPPQSLMTGPATGCREVLLADSGPHLLAQVNGVKGS